MIAPIRLLGVLLASLCAQAAQAQDAAPYFAKKTITIYIGNTAGGTYDLYGRLAARFLGRFIPGNPTIVAENMPGAGTLRAANFIYNVAPRDGTALGIVAETVAIEQAMANPSVQYDARRFTWVGRLVSSAGVHVMWHTSKVQSIEDAKVHEGLLAGTGAGNVGETVPALMNAFLGTKFRIVRGYPSASEAMLAMERGEVEGVAANWIGLKASKPDWIRDGKIKVILQYLPKRSRDIPDAPSLGDIGVSEESRQLFGLYGSMALVGRSLFAAPDVPPANAKILRDAFDAMGRDPEFLAEAARVGADLDMASGKDLQDSIGETLTVPQSAIEKAKAIYAK